jgi:hypothetical protein
MRPISAVLERLVRRSDVWNFEPSAATAEPATGTMMRWKIDFVVASGCTSTAKFGSRPASRSRDT